MRRKLFWTGVSMIALLLVLLGVVMFYIDTLARRAIEVAGTYSLGVATSLDSLRLGLAGGTCSLANLQVANPAGFQAPHFLHMRQGHLTISLGSLRRQRVVLPKLELTGLDVNIEQRQGTSNYQVILDHLASRQGTSDPDVDGRKFIIEELVIRDVNVHVSLMTFGSKPTVLTVPIKEIRLFDVGSDSDGGLLLRELMATVVQTVLLAAATDSSQLPSAVALGLRASLGGVEQLAGVGLEVGGRVLGEALGVSDDLLDGAGRSLEGVGKAIEELGNMLRPREQTAPQP
jgi:hypothetical protein